MLGGARGLGGGSEYNKDMTVLCSEPPLYPPLSRQVSGRDPAVFPFAGEKGGELLLILTNGFFNA
jgi:hypothetical protein